MADEPLAPNKGELLPEEMLTSAIELLQISRAVGEEGSWPDAYAPLRESGAVEALEARQVIIAMLASREYVNWSVAYELPDPGSVRPNYRLSRDWQMWPSDPPSDSVGQTVLIEQATIVADLLFEQLRLEANSTFQSRDADAAKGQAGDADPSIIPLPNARTAGPLYRLTKDWPGWPSLGITRQQTVDAAHAHFGLIADSVFQTIKAITISRRRSHTSTSKAKDGVHLKEGGTNVTEELLSLYSRWVEEGHTVYVQRGGKKAPKDAKLFQEWLPALVEPDAKMATDPPTAESSIVMVTPGRKMANIASSSMIMDTSTTTDSRSLVATPCTAASLSTDTPGTLSPEALEELRALDEKSFCGLFLALGKEWKSRKGGAGPTTAMAKRQCTKRIRSEEPEVDESPLVIREKRVRKAVGPRSSIEWSGTEGHDAAAQEEDDESEFGSEDADDDNDDDDDDDGDDGEEEDENMA